jgi:hypothetical protein
VDSFAIMRIEEASCWGLELHSGLRACIFLLAALVEVYWEEIA